MFVCRDVNLLCDKIPNWTWRLQVFESHSAPHGLYLVGRICGKQRQSLMLPNSGPVCLLNSPIYSLKCLQKSVRDTGKNILTLLHQETVRGLRKKLEFWEKSEFWLKKNRIPEKNKNFEIKIRILRKNKS